MDAELGDPGHVGHVLEPAAGVEVGQQPDRQPERPAAASSDTNPARWPPSSSAFGISVGEHASGEGQEDQHASTRSVAHHQEVEGERR